MTPLTPERTNRSQASWLLLFGCFLISFAGVVHNLPGKRRQILFLCTGNYYRSRMAEEIFNHAARQAGLDFSAASKALASPLNTIGNVGPIAQPAVSILESSGIPVRSRQRWPQTVSESDFERADTVIALNLPEHQPMILKRFPQYAGRVIYWNVPDIGEMPIEKAFSLLKNQIQNLISDLKRNNPQRSFK